MYKYSDLNELVSDYKNRIADIFGELPNIPGLRNPQVYVFPQVWGNTATGLDDGNSFSGQAFTDALTTVICEDVKDNIAVYFNGEFGYFIDRANQTFVDDLKAMAMKPKSKATCYLVRKD